MIGMGTPSNHSRIPRPMFASRLCGHTFPNTLQFPPARTLWGREAWDAGSKALFAHSQDEPEMSSPCPPLTMGAPRRLADTWPPRSLQWTPPRPTLSDIR
jgi:hypothetical protein